MSQLGDDVGCCQAAHLGADGAGDKPVARQQTRFRLDGNRDAGGVDIGISLTAVEIVNRNAAPFIAQVRNRANGFDAPIGRDEHGELGRQAGLSPRRLAGSISRANGRTSARAERLAEAVRTWGAELVLLSGGGAGSESLRQALRERSGVDVDRLDPFRKIGYSPESEAGKAARQYGPAMAVAAGLALTGLGEA